MKTILMEDQKRAYLVGPSFYVNFSSSQMLLFSVVQLLLFSLLFTFSFPLKFPELIIVFQVKDLNEAEFALIELWRDYVQLVPSYLAK